MAHDSAGRHFSSCGTGLGRNSSSALALSSGSCRLASQHTLSKRCIAERYKRTPLVALRRLPTPMAQVGVPLGLARANQTGSVLVVHCAVDMPYARRFLYQGAS
jgi:hypothetical protein